MSVIVHQWIFDIIVGLWSSNFNIACVIIVLPIFMYPAGAMLIQQSTTDKDYCWERIDLYVDEIGFT